MTDGGSRPPADLDHAGTFAACSLLSAVLSLLMLALTSVPVPQDPAEQLIFIAARRPLIALEAVATLMWAVFSVPLVVALGRLLRPRGAGLAATATILSAAGILMLGYAIRTYLGAALSIVAASSRPGAPEAVYQAAIWRSLSFFLTDPGLMTWGLGQFLFGWLARRSGVLPNWVAWVGILGGLAGLLTDAVYQTGALATVQVLSFTIWGFATGVVLLRAWRARGKTPGPAGTTA